MSKRGRTSRKSKGTTYKAYFMYPSKGKVVVKKVAQGSVLSEVEREARKQRRRLSAKHGAYGPITIYKGNKVHKVV